ncbi:MAG: sulfate permease [Thermoleophilia bacterium]|jgi:high affinity sulfate transporter 1|nr:sulfate permease [Thermoleophilia bacterium]
MPDATPRRAERLLPCLGWLPGYRRDWIAPDLVAGATLWALVVPEALAYAAIAGVPVQYGLYAVPLALVGYFAFGSSRDLFVGPSSAVAAISASGVAAVAGAGADPERIIALTAVLSLLAGALYVVLGLLRTGWVARFFAAPVLTGFIVGLGLYVVIGQLPKLVGIPKPDGNTLQVLLDWLRSIADWSAWSVGVGLVCLAALLLAERLMPRLPAALAVAAIAILVTSASGLEDQVAVVGPIPTGFSFVPWSSVSADDVWGLLPGAAALVVVGFAESIAVAKALAVGHGREVDADRELVGYGAANLGAGVLQGYSVCGSLSKSAAAEKAGGRTPVLLLVTAGLVLLTILFLAGVFEQLPEPTLAAIVINAVWGMIGPAKIARLARVSGGEFTLAVGATAGVLLFDVLGGILVGVVLSFVLLIRRIDRPHIAVLGRDPASGSFIDVARHPEAAEVPGALVVRIDGPIVFSNADIVAARLRELMDGRPTPPHTLVLDLQRVSQIDVTGDDAIRAVLADCGRRGTTLAIARAGQDPHEFMRRDGLLDEIGADRVVEQVRDAVRPGNEGTP